MKQQHSKIPSALTTSIGEMLRLSVACSLVAFATLPYAAFAKDLVPKEKASSEAKPADEKPAKEENPAKPEPRSGEEAIRLGIEYLIGHQQADGGWNQGGGWRQNLKEKGGRVEAANLEDPSDLGNTCVSLVALLRAGHSPNAGKYRENTAKAFDFICRFVEKADEDSLYVTPVRDTQLQVKIGTYVDTFLAGWVLSELKGHLADDASETRRAAALDKVVKKVERNQKDDGSFSGNSGWASVLSQGLCSKALNLASRSGAKVSQSALDNDQKQNVAGLDVAKGDFSAPVSAATEPSSAGVSLYRETSKLNGLTENWKSNLERKKKAEQVLANASAPAPAKEQAQSDLGKIASDERAAQVAAQAVGSKLGNDRFVAGFGNNGGEEFLSYMNMAEGLHANGGKQWDEWKPKMEKTVAGAQNQDGSWAGQHCITGRTFCTSAALLTLLAGSEATAAKVTSTEPAPAEKTDK